MFKRCGLVALLCLAGLRCSGSLGVQSALADTVARGANDLLPALVHDYEAQGDSAIDTADNAADALTALQSVRAHWSAFWTRWSALTTVLNAYTTGLNAVNAGSSPSETLTTLIPPVITAWCALTVALHDVSALGLTVHIPCPTEPVQPAEYTPPATTPAPTAGSH